MSKNIYDLIIIGSGPAGYTAAIYAARFKLNTLLFGKETGGIAVTAPEITNWPGTKSISGKDLMLKFKDHAKSYDNVRIIDQEVNDIKTKNNIFLVHAGKDFYQTKTLILALGLIRRKLNIPGEKEFSGKGVAYCATCDAPFFKDKNVAVVGGANSAVVSALLLTEYAKKVYIIYRNSKLRADPVWLEKVKKNKKIQVICCANVIKAQGKQFLEKIFLDTKKEIKVSGLFIEIGSIPSTALAKGLNVALDKNNFIRINNDCFTNTKGVFAAGDITNGSSVKQIITAAAEGSIAASSAYQYLQNR